jgi:hypothetical protein
MSIISKRILRVLLLLSFTISLNADLIESGGSLKNSIMMQLLLGLSSVSARVYIQDSTIISETKSLFLRFISPLNRSPVPYIGLIGEGKYYLGIYSYLLDEGAVVMGKSYTINKGLIYTFDDSSTYIDSGRTLERYLLSVMERSKVIDTCIYHQPLSTYVPESLLVSTRVLSQSRNSVLPPFTNNTLEYNDFSLFDLLGRTASFRINGLNIRRQQSGIYLMRAASRTEKVLLNSASH